MLLQYFSFFLRLNISQLIFPDADVLAAEASTYAVKGSYLSIFSGLCSLPTLWIVWWQILPPAGPCIPTLSWPTTSANWTCFLKETKQKKHNKTLKICSLTYWHLFNFANLIIAPAKLLRVWLNLILIKLQTHQCDE